MVVTGALLASTAGSAQAAPGDLDPTFSADGKTTTDFAGDFDHGEGIAIQPDGKSVVVGEAGGPGNADDFGVARYRTNGGLDNTFAGDGKQTTDIATRGDEANAVVLQPDGKIVVAGKARNTATTAGNDDFALARYTPSGAPDESFSGDGKTRTDFAETADKFEVAHAVALQPDGKIVVAGRIGVAGNPNFVVARYKANGALDTTFDGDGRATIDFAGQFDSAEGVAVQPDGKIVVAGSARDSGGVFDFGVARLNSDGTPDGTFSGDGKTRTDFGSGQDLGAALVLQGDGKIVVAGEAEDSAGDERFALARYRTNGGLDTTFSADGKTTTAFTSDANAEAIALQPDGKFVVSGDSGSPGSADFALARYRTNGSLDTDFADQGKTITEIGNRSTGAGVAVQADGRIVVAGDADNAGNNNFALARYLGS